MKIILILSLVFALASCQAESEENGNETLSDVTSLYSLNTTIAQVDGNIIYIHEGLKIVDLMRNLMATDDSTATYVAKANDGTIKTREELFEFDQIVITSESGEYTRTYTIRYFG